MDTKLACITVQYTYYIEVPEARNRIYQIYFLEQGKDSISSTEL